MPFQYSRKIKVIQSLKFSVRNNNLLQQEKAHSSQVLAIS
jgi:hypothetical protein